MWAFLEAQKNLEKVKIKSVKRSSECTSCGLVHIKINALCASYLLQHQTKQRLREKQKISLLTQVEPLPSLTWTSRGCF